MKVLFLAAICTLFILGVFSSDFETEDVFIPSQCDSIAKPGDHLLLEYTISFANGTVASYLKRPTQLYHVHLVESSEEYPISAALKGMCKNATRRVTWQDPAKVNMLPIFLSDTDINNLEEGISIEIYLLHITEPEDYRIFDHLYSSNISAVMDMVDEHKGINALDEWGQTALMMAVQMQKLEVVAALLNTRMPKVNVNTAKSSGFTALFYAVEISSPSILSALLRRGADPNVIIQQEGSVGTTPLHLACKFEKSKHAEMLLEYGAIPDARNEHGQVPLQLLPLDAVRSTKLYFKRMFEEAMAKQAAIAAASLDSSSSSSSSSETTMRGQNEL